MFFFTSTSRFLMLAIDFGSTGPFSLGITLCNVLLKRIIVKFMRVTVLTTTLVLNNAFKLQDK